MAQRHFNFLPQSFTPDQPMSDAPLDFASAQHEIEQDQPQTVIVWGSKGVARNDPDFYAAFVLNHLLGGGGLTSRLNEVIRRQHGLTYGAGSDLSPDIHGPTWQGMLATRADQAGAARDLLNATLDKVAAGDISQAELDEAIGYITGSFPLNLDRNASITNYLIVMQLHQLGMDYLGRRNDLFRAVTLDQVKAVAAKLLTYPRLVVSVGRTTPHAEVVGDEPVKPEHSDEAPAH